MVYFWDLLGDHAERWVKPFLPKKTVSQTADRRKLIDPSK